MYHIGDLSAMRSLQPFCYLTANTHYDPVPLFPSVMTVIV